MFATQQGGDDSSAVQYGGDIVPADMPHGLHWFAAIDRPENLMACSSLRLPETVLLATTSRILARRCINHEDGGFCGDNAGRGVRCRRYARRDVNGERNGAVTCGHDASMILSASAMHHCIRMLLHSNPERRQPADP